MNPFSLTVSITSLLLGCAKVAKAAHDARSIYKGASLTMSSVATECSAVTVALSHLQNICGSGTLDENSLSSLECVITGCTLTLSVLEEYVVELHSVQESASSEFKPLKAKAKFKVVWNESEIKELSQQLQGHKSSIMLLLNIAESKSRSHAHDTLKANIAKLETLLDRAMTSRKKKPASSIDNSMLAFSDTRSKLREDDESTLSKTTFEFDDMIVNSRVYREAMRKHQTPIRSKRESEVRQPSRNTGRVLMNLADLEISHQQQANDGTSLSTKKVPDSMVIEDGANNVRTAAESLKLESGHRADPTQAIAMANSVSPAIQLWEIVQDDRDISKPKAFFNADKDKVKTLVSGDSTKGKKERRRRHRILDPPTERSFDQEPEETIIRNEARASRKESKERNRLRDVAARGIAEGILTAAALNQESHADGSNLRHNAARTVSSGNHIVHQNGDDPREKDRSRRNPVQPPFVPRIDDTTQMGLGISSDQGPPMQKLDVDVPEEYRDHYIRQSKKTKHFVDKWLECQPHQPSSPPQDVDDKGTSSMHTTPERIEKHRQSSQSFSRTKSRILGSEDSMVDNSLPDARAFQWRDLETSYSIPEDGSSITIPILTEKDKEKEKEKEGDLTNSSNKSQTCLLFEYLEGEEGLDSHGRPSMRVKVTPQMRVSSRRRI